MRLVYAVVLFLIISIGAIWYQMEPKAEGDWVDYLATTTTATVSSTTVTLAPVRNWTYDEQDVTVSTDWQSEVVIPFADVVAVWFVLEKFGPTPLIGHTYLTFELKNGEAYSFSIEARREWGEEYSPWRGLFRQYERAYTWSTERDALARRLVRQKGEVYMYQLQLSAAEVEHVLRAVAQATNESAHTPAFYNTLTANCTNLLAAIINDYKPGTLPYHYSWNLPGASVDYLVQQGYISISDESIASAPGYLTPYHTDLVAVRTHEPADFSRHVRELLPK